MNPILIAMLLAFFLSISITACSSYNSNTDQNNIGNNIPDTSSTMSPTYKSMNNPSENKIDNIKTEISPEGKFISAEKVSNILSTKNKEVIDSLGLSDLDNVKSVNNERFYVPVFFCAKLGILIGFNGANFDSIDKVKEKDETPIFVIPTNGTTISLDKNINFRVGDDMKQFKANFGEGKDSKEGNLKTDKQYSFLKYAISNLSINFRSLNGDEFKEYDVYITKLQSTEDIKPSGTSNAKKNNTKVPLINYIGRWHIDGDIKVGENEYNKKLEIKDINNSNNVIFNLSFFRITGIYDVSAKIEGNIAKFYQAPIGGTLEFYDNGILVSIDKSELEYIKIGNLNFNSKDMAVNDNLCSPGEDILFSFKIKDTNKVLSVCIAKQEQPSYIVYRYGTKDNIELEFPQDKKDSWSKFYYSYYLRPGGKQNLGLDLNSLSFDNGGYNYRIYQDYSAENETTRVGITIMENATKNMFEIEGIENSMVGSLINLRNNTKIKQIPQ